ncbi:unnamed protein product [Adineta ricciae]|uniref:Uncharacterized protein n=1 Tax=Adineta ricciae TaxID=249248 RepID=A0A813SP40_ADIRI|nr:unnamed protein product [Adineta ricciae]CAF1555507.1 unnamed protein product [Adineta ricciae]
MRRCLIFFSTGAVTGLFLSNVIDHLHSQRSSRLERNPYLNFIKYGLPSSQNLEYYRQYITSIDYARRIPSWVGYSLSRDYLSKCSFQPKSTRTRSEFQSQCQMVPTEFQATNEDYYDSGWSRGHMAPAGDHKYGSQEAMNETFILSANIVPQDLDNNGNYWQRIEYFTRNLAKQFDFVHVITGPLFIPNEQKSLDADDDFPIKQMTYNVIGENEVHVPTHLFKCVLVENQNQRDMGVGCFVIPNEPIDRNRLLTDFAVSLANVERRTGLHLFHKKIRVDEVPFLCDKTSCELLGKDAMSHELIEQIEYARRVRRCKTMEQLQKLWNEVESKRYATIDKWLTSAYAKRLAELDTQKLKHDD